MTGGGGLGGPDVQVDDGTIAQARDLLLGIEKQGRVSAVRLEWVAERQSTGKWTGLTEASRARQAASSVSTELTAAIESAARTVNQFCELVQLTQAAFHETDETRQQAMLAQLTALNEESLGGLESTAPFAERFDALLRDLFAPFGFLPSSLLPTIK